MSKRLLVACYTSELRATAMGYLAHTQWLEKMSKRYTQTKCERCGKFHIWKRKESETVKVLPKQDDTLQRIVPYHEYNNGYTEDKTPEELVVELVENYNKLVDYLDNKK